MILNLINKPFDHLIIPDFLTLEESTILFNNAREVLDKKAYDNRTMFADRDFQQSSIGLFGADMSIEPHDNALAIKIQDNLEQVREFYNLDKEEFHWVGSLNITNPDEYLGPHTDNWQYVKQTNPNAGLIKLLLYVGDGNEDYTGWGTRLYNGKDKNENFVCEVPYKPGTALAFKATKDSYHGTQYPNGLNSYRFIYGAELTDT